MDWLKSQPGTGMVKSQIWFVENGNNDNLTIFHAITNAM
jgi:hypothetical protein